MEHRYDRRLLLCRVIVVYRSGVPLRWAEVPVWYLSPPPHLRCGGSIFNLGIQHSTPLEAYSFQWSGAWDIDELTLQYPRLVLYEISADRISAAS